MRRLVVEPGVSYGRLTVIREARLGLHTGAVCSCQCGAEVTVAMNRLLNGHTKSCGCLKREMAKQRATTHGGCRTRTNMIWATMRQRCLNPKNKGFVNYGGRGIRIDPRWDDYANFLADMGEAPIGYSIERKENDGNYEPGNCVWIPRGDQNKNTRRNRLIQFRGERLTLADWARKLGMQPRTLHLRFERGWTKEQALTSPLGSYVKR